VASARERGAQLLDGLRDLASRHRSIGDVRGLGLMAAIELVQPDTGDGRVPDPDRTKRVQAAALARKLIVLTAGTYVNVIRIIPPLVTTAEEVDQAVGILDEALTAAAA
jgi:4-aminobutyrate aminotransferase